MLGSREGACRAGRQRLAKATGAPPLHLWEAAFPTEEGLEVSVHYKEMTLAVERDWEWKKGRMEALPAPVEDTGEYTSEPHAISLFHKQPHRFEVSEN